jgi:hypothetical protein
MRGKYPDSASTYKILVYRDGVRFFLQVLVRLSTMHVLQDRGRFLGKNRRDRASLSKMVNLKGSKYNKFWQVV